MNSHLLLFNFYGEDIEKHKENNLSRALAICLKNDVVLLNYFLKEILDESEFRDLYNNIEEDFYIEIDIQKRIADIENTGKLKAVALTPINLTDSIKNNPKPHNTKDPITDLYIRVKDLTIIIEVKKYDEDCISQLLGQVGKLINDDKVDKEAVTLKSLMWSEVIERILTTRQYLSSLNKNNIFIDDFIKFFEERFPSWFPIKTLNQLPFTTDENNPTYHQIFRRLEIIKRQTGFSPLKEYQNRTVIPVDFKWATEVQIGVTRNPKNNGNSIRIGIWPGDIKQQGQYLFSKPLDWTEQKSLLVDNEKYDLTIEPYLSFRHFSRGFASINLRNSLRKYAKKSHTKTAFDKLAGRWWKDHWQTFESFIDEIFDFDWRNNKDLQWNQNFINSNRQYFDLSFGFSVYVYLPYEKAVYLEKDSIDGEVPLLAKHIKKIVEAIKNLLEGQ